MKVATDPTRIETAIITGTRRATSEAVAGGATRNANTSRVPTVRNDAITTTATNASIVTWASPGCRLSAAAFAREKLSTRNGRYSRMVTSNVTALATAIT